MIVDLVSIDADKEWYSAEKCNIVYNPLISKNWTF